MAKRHITDHHFDHYSPWRKRNLNRISMIHINCDVGEGLHNEHLLMPFISACSIACGGHAGDEQMMENVITLAQQHNVLIGAHPSYPDSVHFGRASMNIPDNDLIKSIRDQINTLQRIAQHHQYPITHIKAHGALYNDIAKDKDRAFVYLEAISPFKKNCQIFVPYQSIIANEAIKQEFQICYEAFADRNYNEDLSLVSRSQSNALITDAQEAIQHIQLMKNNQLVNTISGKQVSIQADTFCVHSDTENALDILKQIHTTFS